MLAYVEAEEGRQQHGSGRPDELPLSLQAHVGVTSSVPSDSKPEFVHVDLFGGTGQVRVVSLVAATAEPFTAVLACELAPSGSVGRHRQEEFPEIILGCAGSGIATVNDVAHPLGPGDAVYLPLGSVLALENRSSDALLVYFIVKARS